MLVISSLCSVYLRCLWPKAGNRRVQVLMPVLCTVHAEEFRAATGTWERDLMYIWRVNVKGLVTPQRQCLSSWGCRAPGVSLNTRVCLRVRVWRACLTPCVLLLTPQSRLHCAVVWMGSTDSWGRCYVASIALYCRQVKGCEGACPVYLAADLDFGLLHLCWMQSWALWNRPGWTGPWCFYPDSCSPAVVFSCQLFPGSSGLKHSSWQGTKMKNLCVWLSAPTGGQEGATAQLSSTGMIGTVLTGQGWMA